MTKELSPFTRTEDGRILLDIDWKPEGKKMRRLYEHEAIERYKDMLDDVYSGVTIAGSSFYASTVLQECDPTAFRIGLDEWIVSEVEEGNIRVEGYEEYEPEGDDD